MAPWRRPRRYICRPPRWRETRTGGRRGDAAAFVPESGRGARRESLCCGNGAQSRCASREGHKGRGRGLSQQSGWQQCVRAVVKQRAASKHIWKNPRVTVCQRQCDRRDRTDTGQSSEYLLVLTLSNQVDGLSALLYLPATVSIVSSRKRQHCVSPTSPSALFVSLRHESARLGYCAVTLLPSCPRWGSKRHAWAEHEQNTTFYRETRFCTPEGC